MSPRPLARLLWAIPLWAWLPSASPASARPLHSAPQAGAQASPREDEFAGWVRALDAGTATAGDEVFTGLAALGARARERLLADFESVDFRARRARASWLAECPSPEATARLLTLLSDPDPEVRRRLVASLGNPALARAAAVERAEALGLCLVEDPSSAVRDEARRALSECALEEAVPALDGALERLPASEARQAAAALAGLPLARERLIARLTGSAATLLPDGVRTALLLGYGRALAEVPGGGEERRERLPFLSGRTHLSEAVRAAAQAALTSFVSRAAELSESERAERVLARLGEEGWPPVECLRRRLDLAWLERGDVAGGLLLARALAQSAQGLAPEEAEGWELRARFFEGAALYALGRAEEARILFDGLALRLDALGLGRSDLFPSPADRYGTKGGGAERIDRQHLAALAHLWRALLALDEGGPNAEVRAALRRVHVLFLQSRVVAQRTDALDPATLDSLLDRDLSPYTLVLLNEKVTPERRGPELDRALFLAKAWGEVAPLEMQGLGGSDASEVPDVLADPERLALLQAMRAAYRRQLVRRLEDLHDPQLGPTDAQERESQGLILRQLLAQLDRGEIDEIKGLSGAKGKKPSTEQLRVLYARLLDFLAPSLHAYTLAGHLRAEGRTGEARALCEQALATLRTAPLGSSLWSELSSARFESLRGATLMDDGQPSEAERSYQEAERRLLAIQTQVEERRAAEDEGSDLAGQLDAQLRQIRILRGDALLSLAVNANVRQGDPARALEYFERAYELNQSPFMQILRACYRARSGKIDEARTVLASVVPVPALYYNIACTHALLGETGPALDYLERDLRANHPTAGSLAQKLEWARKDPDLASLRGEPRFERLFAGH